MVPALADHRDRRQPLEGADPEPGRAVVRDPVRADPARHVLPQPLADGRARQPPLDDRRRGGRGDRDHRAERVPARADAARPERRLSQRACQAASSSASRSGSSPMPGNDLGVGEGRRDGVVDRAEAQAGADRLADVDLRPRRPSADRRAQSGSSCSIPCAVRKASSTTSTLRSVSLALAAASTRSSIVTGGTGPVALNDAGQRGAGPKEEEVGEVARVDRLERPGERGRHDHLAAAGGAMRPPREPPGVVVRPDDEPGPHDRRPLAERPRSRAARRAPSARRRSRRRSPRSSRPRASRAARSRRAAPRGRRRPRSSRRRRSARPGRGARSAESPTSRGR